MLLSPNQPCLFGDDLPADITSVVEPDLPAYDRFIVAFSGGKDSLGCLLTLLDRGVPRHKIELWHHGIDGAEQPFMDWPITASYCNAVAKALGVPIYFSWRIGGFEREMLRDNEATADVFSETPTGDMIFKSKGDSTGTRLKFPQVGANLQTRWCSAYLKIDVAARAITGQDRFRSGRFLFITGERAEESSNRAKYKALEPHRCHTRTRKIEQWRPVLKWSEKAIWEIIERYRVRPHPAYQIGLGRVSCMNCIFSSNDQWATVEKLSPLQFGKVSYFEQKFGVTIRRDGDIRQAAAKGKPMDMSPELAKLAVSEVYDMTVILEPDEVWTLPKGAFGESCGPT